MIKFERTINNKQMPVDTPSVFYIPDKSGADNILNEDGEIVKGRIIAEKQEGYRVGSRPHFGTCKRNNK